MTDTLEQQEITIFYNHAAEESYLRWLNTLASKVESLSTAYNKFAETVGLDLFSSDTLKYLSSGNHESWVGSEIENAVNKFDAPLRPAYLEYYWKQFRGIEKLVLEVNSYKRIFEMSSVPPFPLELASTLPDIKDGQFQITNEFLKGTKKYFEIKVKPNNRAYELLNQIKTAYEELSELINKKNGKIYNYGTAWDTSSNHFPQMNFFLTRRSDGTITICDQTLKQLL